jgi:hypothetical protein
MIPSTSATPADEISAGTSRSAQWIVTRPTRRPRPTSSITARPSPQVSSSSSVCPGYEKPPAAITSFEIGAVTMASSGPTDSRAPPDRSDDPAAAAGSGRPGRPRAREDASRPRRARRPRSAASTSPCGQLRLARGPAQRGRDARPRGISDVSAMRGRALTAAPARPPRRSGSAHLGIHFSNSGMVRRSASSGRSFAALIIGDLARIEAVEILNSSRRGRSRSGRDPLLQVRSVLDVRGRVGFAEVVSPPPTRSAGDTCARAIEIALRARPSRSFSEPRLARASGGASGGTPSRMQHGSARRA